MSKFKQLEHNGPIFPKEFDELDSYEINGITIKGLPLEMLWIYSRYIETEYVQEKVFRDNFYSCFVLECEKANIDKKIKTLKFPLDFDVALKHFKQLQDENKEIKKNRSKEEKNLEKEEKAEIKAKYGFATIDGTSQPIGAYTIEPPGLFMARGDNPLKGLWKYRVKPEDVTINCTGNAPVAPQGRSWKGVESNTNNYYTFSFDLNIGNKEFWCKHIRFSYSSSVGQSADQQKFATAKELADNFVQMQEHIRKGYEDTKVHEDNRTVIECAIIAWLIQNTSIRVGAEKDLDVSADTVGASTLATKNVKLRIEGTKHIMSLNFLGKDSIEYQNEFEIPEQIYIHLGWKLHNSLPEQKIFSVDSGEVNRFLQECVKSTSAKMFRPAIGTATLVAELKKANIKPTDSIQQKILAFTKANIATAELLNHKKAASKNYDVAYKKLKEQLKELKQKQVELKISVEKQLQELVAELIAAKKVFTGEKLANAKERINGKKIKLGEKLIKMGERVVALENKLMLKKDTKTTAIGTSKGSYIDPQVIVSWAKSVNLPIEKLYTKSLQERFSWALNVDENFWASYTLN